MSRLSCCTRLTWFLLSLVAAEMACTRRVDPRDRGASTQITTANPSSGTIANAASVNRIPTALDPSPVVDSERTVLRHVDPEGLFSAARNLKQKGVVLNVWATWCGPCREELPMLAKVAKAYKARGISILPLSVDEPESESKIAGMLREFGFAPPYYVAKPSIAAMKVALHEAWPGNIPVSFILDGTAKRRYFFNAEVYEEELTPKLDALLNGTLPEGRTSHGLIPGLTL